MRRASGTGIPDTTSGFRAYNREAALQLQVVSNYTYTLESLIQAGKMLVARRARADRQQPEDPRLAAGRLHRPVRAAERGGRLPCLRPVRAAAGVHVVAIVFAVAALAAFGPFLVDWIVHGDTTGHIQSLILGAVLALTAVQMFGLGVVGDAIAGQRVIAQRTFERVRRLELEAGIGPSHYEPALSPRPARRPRAYTRAAPRSAIEARSASEPHRSGPGRRGRQRLRQVRDRETHRAAAGGRLPGAAGALVDRTGAAEAHEVGCGEGELACRLAAAG